MITLQGLISRCNSRKELRSTWQQRRHKVSPPRPERSVGALTRTLPSEFPWEACWSGGILVCADELFNGKLGRLRVIRSSFGLGRRLIDNRDLGGSVSRVIIAAHFLRSSVGRNRRNLNRRSQRKVRSVLAVNIIFRRVKATLAQGFMWCL